MLACVSGKHKGVGAGWPGEWAGLGGRESLGGVGGVVVGRVPHWCSVATPAFGEATGRLEGSGGVCV